VMMGSKNESAPVKRRSTRPQLGVEFRESHCIYRRRTRALHIISFAVVLGAGG
jgi:hypothetical protein